MGVTCPSLIALVIIYKFTPQDVFFEMLQIFIIISKYILSQLPGRYS